MKQPQVLEQTTISGMTVSSIFVPTGTEGGYFETMLFLSEDVEGLTHFETLNDSASWKENHEALVTKVRNALK